MKYLLIFIATLLFGHTVYVPQDFNIHLPKDYKIKKYSSLKEVDFNNSFAILDNNDILYILTHNLKIITGIEPQREVIISYKPFNKIETIANVDLPTKIFLSVFNKKFKFVKGSLEDLEDKKVDAIVVHHKINGFFNYDSSDFGVKFHKYYLVSSQKLEKRNDSDAEFLKEYLIDEGLTNSSLITRNLIIYGLYFDKKLDFFDLIDNKYFNSSNNENLLKVILTPTWPPFNFIRDNKLVGIGVDMWKLIAKKAGLQYTLITNPIWLDVLKAIKNKQADISPNTSATPDRKKYAIFSKPYMEFPYAIICRKNETIKSIKNISNIAVGYHYTAHIEMKNKYPHIKYIGVKNAEEAIKLVERGKAQCAVDILPVVAYIVNKNHFVNLEVKYLTPFTFKFQVMLRKDLKDVRDKINLAINQISEDEKQEIINRYVSLTIKESHNQFLETALIVFLFLTVVLSYIYLKTKKEAQIDELTQILNRRGFDNEVKNLKIGSIIFMDIDKFKDINDTYGHDFGDYVLKEFARIIKKNIRSSDVFARIGGEEFIIILPETSYIHAFKVAEKLKKAIESHDFQGVKVTASFGVSEFESDLEQAIKRADEALYEAKNSGRNQVKGKK